MRTAASDLDAAVFFWGRCEHRSLCPNGSDRFENSGGVMKEEIDVKGVRQLLDEEAEFLLLDCRNPDEREFAHIQKSEFIPMNELPNRVSELEPHRDRHIVVYCHHGGRSDMVCQWLRSQGFSQVQNMLGGIDAWAVEVDPAMRRY